MTEASPIEEMVDRANWLPHFRYASEVWREALDGDVGLPDRAIAVATAGRLVRRACAAREPEEAVDLYIGAVCAITIAAQEDDPATYHAGVRLLQRAARLMKENPK